MRLNVSTRLILFASALTILSAGMAFWFVQGATRGELEEQLAGDLRRLARDGSALIDGALISRSPNSAHESRLTRPALEHIRRSLSIPANDPEAPARESRVYLVRPGEPPRQPDVLHFLRLPFSDETRTPESSLQHTAIAEPYQRTAFRDGSPTSEWIPDMNEPWLSAAAPLIDERGRVVGLLQIERPVPILQGLLAKQTQALWRAMVASLAAGIIMATIFSRTLVGRLRLLTDAIRALGRGDFERRLPISNRDEISDLADDINRMATSLQQTQAKAQEATRAVVTSGRLAAVGQMAAGIAHEINNPLTWVRANLALLGEHCGELRDQIKSNSIEASAQAVAEESSEMISEALEGVDRALAIVQDIKGFAHAGNGRQETTDLAQLLEQVLRVASPQTRGVEVRQRFDPTPSIRAETQALKQVFLNLIVNASQAVGPGGLIEIRTAQVADHVVASVSDNGPGIRFEDRPRLFDPFFTTKPVGEGTGLGLSICFEIIRRHGGIIHVESEAGQGATFEVHLPVNDPDGDDLSIQA